MVSLVWKEIKRRINIRQQLGRGERVAETALDNKDEVYRNITTNQLKAIDNAYTELCKELADCKHF